MKIWSPQAIATIDSLYCLLAAFFVMAAPDTPPAQAMADKPVCQMAIDATWQGDIHVDVDLWVRGPGDIPVGYSAQSGRVFNLVRDDTGTLTDFLGINAERACASGLPNGDYVINLHLYRTVVDFPIKVKVDVSLIDTYRAMMKEIASKEVSLATTGQELTVMRFTMKDGEIVSGSTHDIPIKIRHGSGNAAPGVNR